MHRIIQFNQRAWLKSYIDMNTNLRKIAKNDFKKDFFKLVNNTFGKIMKNVRKPSHTKSVIAEKRNNYLVSEPNYQST